MTAATGAQFKSQRRFALHALRDLGFGKSQMEERIREQADMIVASFRANGPDKPLDPTDSIQVPSFLGE